MTTTHGECSWMTLFHYDRPHVGALCTKRELLDVASFDLLEMDRLMAMQPACLRWMLDTPVEWWYGGLLHACFDLLCNGTPYDEVRPLFHLVLSVTRTTALQFMLRTVNYFGEMPIHIISHRTPGRANASYILYRMCMSESLPYLYTLRTTLERLRVNGHRSAHRRVFAACLRDLHRHGTSCRGGRPSHSCLDSSIDYDTHHR
jgi:hypothetical protein